MRKPNLKNRHFNSPNSSNIQRKNTNHVKNKASESPNMALLGQTLFGSKNYKRFLNG